MTFAFKQLNKSHFPLLLKWLESPHVKKWWDCDVDYTIEIVCEKYSSYTKGYKIVEGIRKTIQCFIINYNQEPIGYIQIYSAHDFYEQNLLLRLPKNLGALDCFIGEEKYLNQGLGSKAISEFLNIHGSKYSHILADPNSNNVAAIKCYENVDFKKIAEQTVEQTGEEKNLMIRELLSVRTQN